MGISRLLFVIASLAWLQADGTPQPESAEGYEPGTIALVRLHEAPLQKDDKVLMRLPLGAELTVQEVKGDWVGGAVRTEQDWKTGWVKKENLVPLASAADHFQRALEQDAGNYHLLLINARLLRDKEKLAEAEKLYDSAVGRLPKEKEAYRQRGYVRYLRGDHRGAVADYDRVLQLDPRDGLALTNRALNHQELGNYAEALRDYDRAMELSRQNVLAMNNAAWLLATCEEPGVRDLKRAMQLAEAACELTGYENPNCLDTLATAHAEAGSLETAVEILDQAIRLAPETLKSELGKRKKIYQTRIQEESKGAGKEGGSGKDGGAAESNGSKGGSSPDKPSS